MSLLVLMSLFNGLTLAALLFITASGLTLSFSLMRVVNLTHGALYMAGGFIGLTVIHATGSWLLAMLAGGGGPQPAHTIACLARGGHLAVVGRRGGEPGAVGLSSLQERSLSVSAPVCFDYFRNRRYFQRLAQQLFAKIQSGAVRPAVTTFPLERAADAHRLLEERRNLGAVALVPGG